MKRLAFPLAAGALLALGALVALTVIRPAAPASRAEVARQIAADLRCPDCQGLSVADSSSGSAVEIRRQIEAQLAAGRSPDQVRQSFVDRYGEWILLRPTAWLAWLLPFAVVVVGAALLGIWLLRRDRGEVDTRPRTLTAAEQARVREEAEALDA
jgi:cytochrome c-type biogenesis protein CcmH